MDGYHGFNSRGQCESPLLPTSGSTVRKKSSLPISHRWLVPFRRNSITAFILVSVSLIYLIPWKSRKSTLNSLVTGSIQGCRIPEVPLWSDSYMSASEAKTYKVSQCGDASKFTKFKDDSTLKLLNHDYDGGKCQVFEVERPVSLNNDRFVLKDVGTFDAGNEIGSLGSAEHIILTCNSTGGDTVFDYQSRVLPTKGSLPSKINYWKTKSKEELPVNVMVLVLDSTSATDAFRQLPKTMKYLLEDLNFVYFSRYHALGEPTFLNAMPLLTGVPTHKFFENKKWLDRWDETEFIWKHFNQSNFATGYMEDIPAVGTFNYGGQTGFIQKPTDFYTRPFFSAWVALGGKTPETCVGTSSVWKYLYNYELEILRTLNGILPSFTMPWLCWPFHDFFDTLSTVEPDALEFFQMLGESKEILDNTVIMIMGDHGFYKGDYAKSNEGLIERRLPLFLIRVPERLTTRFIPNAESIILQNSKQVTSHYDVFKTLFHLSQLGKQNLEKGNLSKSGLGRSLFELLPSNRRCDEAGIPKEWCACNLPEASSGRDWLGFPNEVEELKLSYGKPYVDKSRI